MRKDLITSLLAVVVFTVALGLVYPLVTTGVAQLAFPNAGDGSQIERDGKVVGSRVLGQDFSRPVEGADGEPETDEEGEPVLEPDLRYFQSRPSATGYSASYTFFGNLGPNSKELADSTRDNVDSYLDRERPFDRALDRSDVPADAAQQSGSGVDPHISKENAAIQSRRIARQRNLPLSRVRELVEENTDGRSLGVLGEPGVNVLELNLALDREGR